MYMYMCGESWLTVKHGKYVYSTLALGKEIVNEETALRKEKEAVCCYAVCCYVHVHYSYVHWVTSIFTSRPV